MVPFPYQQPTLDPQQYANWAPPSPGTGLIQPPPRHAPLPEEFGLLDDNRDHIRAWRRLGMELLGNAPYQEASDGKVELTADIKSKLLREWGDVDPRSPPPVYDVRWRVPREAPPGYGEDGRRWDRDAVVRRERRGTAEPVRFGESWRGSGKGKGQGKANANAKASASETLRPASTHSLG